MQKIIIRFTQLFLSLLIRIFYIGRVKLSIDKNVKLNRPIVIIANHASMLDPFIIGSFLPLKTFLKITPFKFMINSIYYYRWWKPLAFIAGGYPTKSKEKINYSSSYGVSVSVALLNQGYSIVMFPEGRLIRNNQRIEAKYGISSILKKYPTRPLLVMIDWDKAGLLRKVSLKFKLAEKNLNQADPNKIMDAIYNLSETKVEKILSSKTSG